MSTDNIKLFIKTNYSDSQLAALIAHTESGKLSYYSCCCLIGLGSAPHALMGAGEYCKGSAHYCDAWFLPFAEEAEMEFYAIADTAAERCDRLLPILHEEVERREQERDYEGEEYWSDADTTREMVNSIKGR